MTSGGNTTTTLVAFTDCVFTGHTVIAGPFLFSAGGAIVTVDIQETANGPFVTHNMLFTRCVFVNSTSASQIATAVSIGNSYSPAVQPAAAY